MNNVIFIYSKIVMRGVSHTNRKYPKDADNKIIYL